MRSHNCNIDVSRLGAEERLRRTRETIGKRKQGFVRIRRRDKGDPKGQAIRTEPSRRRYRREVHQIDKVRVVTEIRIALDGLGLNLFMSEDRACGWQNKHVHGFPLRFGGSPEIRQSILRLESIGCREVLTLRNNLPHHRVHLIGVTVEKTLNRGITFGNPGSGIQKIRGAPKNRIVDLDSLAAQFLEARNRPMVQLFRLLIAEKAQFARSGNTKTEGGTPRWRSFRFARV